MHRSTRLDKVQFVNDVLVGDSYAGRPIMSSMLQSTREPIHDTFDVARILLTP